RATRCRWTPSRPTAPWPTRRWRQRGGRWRGRPGRAWGGRLCWASPAPSRANSAGKQRGQPCQRMGRGEKRCRAGWGEREQGRDVSLEDLCRDRPELLAAAREQVAQVQALAQRLGIGGPAAESHPVCQDVTVPQGRAAIAPARRIGELEVLSELGRGG